MLKRVTNRLKLANHVLQHGRLPAQDVRTVPAITGDEIAECRSFFPLDKFFIFGHARSGTTLLTRLIRLHPEVHCNYQGHFFTRPPTLEGLVNRLEIEDWLTRRSNRWNRGRDLSPVVLRAVSDFIMEREARPMGVKVVGDKSPNSLLDGEAVQLAHKIYPDGKIIFIVRDGRDAAVSHRFQSFIDATQHLNKQDWTLREAFERDPEPFLHGERSIFTEDAIQNAANGWVKNITETVALGEKLYKDQFITLRYEDLLAQPWDQMSHLWDFLGVRTDSQELPEILRVELESNPDRDWQKQKAGELVSPLEKGKSGSWRDLFTLRDKQVFKDVAGELLINWNYELATDW
jgi:LPS sulfotransferase NodH